MDKEALFERVKSMITNSTNNPKYISLSTAKMADILEISSDEIDQALQELVNEGRLRRAQLSEPPNYLVYMLP